MAVVLPVLEPVLLPETVGEMMVPEPVPVPVPVGLVPPEPDAVAEGEPVLEPVCVEEPPPLDCPPDG